MMTTKTQAVYQDSYEHNTESKESATLSAVFQNLI